MSNTRVTTKKVRFSYVHVFEPTAMNEGDTKKYSVSILIPKEDKATVKAIEAAIKTALELGKSKHFGGTLPKKWENPLRDGDEEKDDEVYAGHYFIHAKSVRKPIILDSDNTLLEDKDEFYSGCYGRAVINFYAYGNGLPSKGVAVGLESCKKLEDGDNLGGGGATMSEILDAYGDDDDLL